MTLCMAVHTGKPLGVQCSPQGLHKPGRMAVILSLWILMDVYQTENNDIVCTVRRGPLLATAPVFLLNSW